MEARRVLRPGGRFLFNVPMLSHGHDLFVTADVQGIKQLFGTGWRLESDDSWRRIHKPLERFEAWKRRAYKKIKTSYTKCGQDAPSVWVYEAVYRKV